MSTTQNGFFGDAAFVQDSWIAPSTAVSDESERSISLAPKLTVRD
jgi:hypothetical protein